MKKMVWLLIVVLLVGCQNQDYGVATTNPPQNQYPNGCVVTQPSDFLVNCIDCATPKNLEL